ncbi:FAD-binding protein [Frigoribacterium sp. CFBP 13712]|uniref:FAD-binding protein n=1 Tax=Frigoribacterium sp. CFBP 13712 TaxID=2775309 RepID=UPI001786D409|nr:FAD-binding protein [Frigoribacterium sp. CFBP 13712]MBD8702747.1 FAD-binding protein [Frigoribacterium sp. CFBP 13712]
MHNWAANVEYSTTDLRRPTTVDEVSDVVTSSRRVKALGSRHSFNRVADTDGTLVSLDRLDVPIELDAEAGTVRVGAGTTHAVLAAELQRHGRALPNLASLPHISVAGAVQTGTHGSGVGNPALSASVAAVEIVRADGSLEVVRRGDDAFEASVVGLGALGVVTALVLDTVPTFDVVQTVHSALPWRTALDRFDDVVGNAYSVSLFTRYTGDSVDQVWSKSRVGDPVGLDLADLGAVPAEVAVHMLPDTAADAVTPQLGVPGPWLDRLPHFRADFTPSAGEEIQSEYLVPAEHAVAAVEALRAIGHRFADVLFVSEIRTIAADDAWLSPSGGRASVAFHFTWRRLADEVLAVLPFVEEALAPFDARPHWGKVATLDRATLRERYPRLDDFAAHARAVDPDGRFRNEHLSRTVLEEAPLD